MSEFLVSIPLRVLRERILRPANERVQEGGAYDEDVEPRVSVMVDLDSESIQSQRGYARMWGWSRGKVRNRWDEIWQDVAEWCSSYGRQMDPEKNPWLDKMPDEWRAYLAKKYAQRPQTPKSPEKAHAKPTLSPREAHEKPKNPGAQAANGDSKPAKSPDEAQREPTSSPPKAHHTIHPSSSSPSPSFNSPTDQSANSRAREASEAADAETGEKDGRSVGRKDFGEKDLEPEDLVQELTVCGLSEAKAEELVAEYPSDEILDQIANYRWRCDYGQAPTSAGWIVWALKTGEPLPEGLRRSTQAAASAKPRSTYVEPDGPPADPERVSEAVAEVRSKIDAAKAREDEKAEERRHRRRPEWARAGPAEAPSNGQAVHLDEPTEQSEPTEHARLR